MTICVCSISLQTHFSFAVANLPFYLFYVYSGEAPQLIWLPHLISTAFSPHALYSWVIVLLREAENAFNLAGKPNSF